jgi:hypothetical protein
VYKSIPIIHRNDYADFSLFNILSTKYTHVSVDNNVDVHSDRDML